MNGTNLIHWLLQTLPPLSLLLLITDSGPSYTYIVGLTTIFAFISIISIIVKLFNFKTRKKYLVRPVLTFLVFVALISIANISYNTALKLAINEAENINIQCNKTGICPTALQGWRKPHKGNVLETKVGKLIKYPLMYNYEVNDFHIDVIKGADLGHLISGGIDKKLTITHINN